MNEFPIDLLEQIQVGPDGESRSLLVLAAELSEENPTQARCLEILEAVAIHYLEKGKAEENRGPDWKPLPPNKIRFDL